MTLLLCEDERDLSFSIKRLLELSKYDVDQAFDGVQALQKLHTNHYDCVILDVMMPRMDGFQVLKMMRGEGDATPVIMLTAKAEIDDKVLGLDAGADDYLTKPFHTKELLARIRVLLRHSNLTEKAITYGDLTLDGNTFEMKAKSSCRLTRTEYQLREFLVQNKGRLVSTELIMESVWDYDSEAEINVVWAYISALRKKLANIGSDVTINAVRGVGYQLGEKQK